MRLIVDNYAIDEPIINILKKIKYECNGAYLNYMEDKGEDILVQCPFHNNGQEKHAACYVYNERMGDLEPGFFHCFACGEQGPLYKIVAHCLSLNDNDARMWLKNNFGGALISQAQYLPEISLCNKATKKVLDEGILRNYDYYHPYMWERKLSKEVVDKFRIGYNPKNHSITFPVRDEKGDLVMITERFINFKRYVIPKEVDKPVYLLNEILKSGITSVVVCESQINCLYSWSLGYPAVCLFGTGSEHQYELLNKSPIRHYYLAFDSDYAGKKGLNRFLNNIRDDVIVDILPIPPNKDLNDLSESEVRNAFNYLVDSDTIL